MNLLRPYKKATKDLSNLKSVINPELKKRNDKLFKALVDNLNRNTSDQKPNEK